MGLSCCTLRYNDNNNNNNIYKTLILEDSKSSQSRYPTQESINKVNQANKKDENIENVKNSDCEPNYTKIIYIDEGIIES